MSVVTDPILEAAPVDAGPPLITMYDATQASHIPLNPSSLPENVAVASYCDGAYASGWLGCVHKYPSLSSHQRVLSIASRFTTIARIIDYEAHQPIYGDPDGVAQWVLRMLQHGVYMPGAYADRSDMPAVQQAYERHGVPRDRTVLWLAAPGVDPQTYLNQGFDMVQDRFAGLYDVSVCKAHVFPGAKPPPPKPPPAEKASGKANFSGTLHCDTGAWEIHGTPGTFKHGTKAQKWSAEIQIDNVNGKWRVHPLDFDAPPLGG